MTFSLTVKTAEERQAEQAAALAAQIIAAIDAHVEAQARSLGYNSAAHCASYVASTVQAWADEAKAFVAWRDAVWQAAFEMQTRYDKDHTVPIVDDLIAALPGWPS